MVDTGGALADGASCLSPYACDRNTREALRASVWCTEGRRRRLRMTAMLHAACSVQRASTYPLSPSSPRPCLHALPSCAYTASPVCFRLPRPRTPPRKVTSEQEMARKMAGKDGASEGDDTIIYKLDIPANRYDLLCLEGVGRALMIFLEKMETPTYRLLDVPAMTTMTVKAPTGVIRPYVVCAILRNCTFDHLAYNSFLDLQVHISWGDVMGRRGEGAGKGDRERGRGDGAERGEGAERGRERERGASVYTGLAGVAVECAFIHCGHERFCMRNSHNHPTTHTYTVRSPLHLGRGP